jgi:ribosomal silencing factor RsfS
LTAEVELHSRAIADFIEQSLKAEGVRPHHIEGRMNLQWVLLDYIDVVVHVFLPQIREFYDLEAYWGEAKSVKTDFDAFHDQTAPASTSPPRKTTRSYSRNN